MTQVIKHLLSISATRIGIALAFFIPLVFTVAWMTGYHNATQRIGELQIAIVNQDGTAGEIIQDKMIRWVPFHSDTLSSVEEANKRMEQGDYSMVVVIPSKFAHDLQAGQAKLIYYINTGTSEVAHAAVERAAGKITEGISKSVDGNANRQPIQAEIIKTHQQGNFAVTMVPILLGFTPYIAMMTMNIHLRISSLMLKSTYGKWDLFWSRQFLLLLISILASLFLSAVIYLFVEPAAPFWKMWMFECFVFLSGICVTQMGLTLFGHSAPFFNLLPIPLMIMTGGTIVPSSMLTPIYQHLGSCLPSGIPGFMQLIYIGHGIWSFVLNLLLLSAVTWGITVLRIYMEKSTASPNEVKATHAR
ncbi:ABC transporter permease [Brevibacillus sp. M2.1A]|uniref:YhgE/Pip domain-containing protein n=1 Tax=Brevibacillus sp. M2.1A TaxID=2738980 RepID=UPI00156B99BA|nr:ABC transporter permease [Brevibacillus sp. M2.1A]MCC8438558.1 ABC transporter permease [Brevibacillus sp. M2.1A]